MSSPKSLWFSPSFPPRGSALRTWSSLGRCSPPGTPDSPWIPQCGMTCVVISVVSTQGRCPSSFAFCDFWSLSRAPVSRSHSESGSNRLTLEQNRVDTWNLVPSRRLERETRTTWGCLGVSLSFRDLASCLRLEVRLVLPEQVAPDI